ncbi:MAG TPA: alpha/beta fold hydrolase [Candidatus Limnocylindrales bacterium]|nr:alpha/beta fold hydrolase [Candidatus Limnocylindrales bacterium]
MSKAFINRDADPTVEGFQHEPEHANGHAFLLTHGAGANCETKLLVAVAAALAAAGFLVLRFDLPFRQERRHGPPRFGSAARDREGIRRAVLVMKARGDGRVFLGGHSYGGRQATMLLAEQPRLVDGLMLLSYPLHPPKKPKELRTEHFPKLTTPALFVHGTRDPFASSAEMKAALAEIPARHELLEVEGAGHDLVGKSGEIEVAARITRAFQKFIDR